MRRWIVLGAAAAVLSAGWAMGTREDASAARCRRSHRTTYRSCRSNRTYRYVPRTTTYRQRRAPVTYRTVNTTYTSTPVAASPRWVDVTPRRTATRTARWVDVTPKRRSAQWVNVTHRRTATRYVQRTRSAYEVPAPAPTASELASASGGSLSVAGTCFT